MKTLRYIYSMGTSALIIAACALVLTFCSDDDDPTPPATNGSGSGVTVTPGISVNTDSELTTVGSYKIDNGIIVVRTSEGNTSNSFIAVSGDCTYGSCALEYHADNNELMCPCHGCAYGVGGNVLQGPATVPLATYAVTVVNDSTNSLKSTLR